MSNFGLSCDVCNRENVGVTWVNGMKFCAKCYQETFGNKNMTENLNNMYEAYLKILNEKDQRITELEEQLKNAIVPKFKVNDELFVIVDNKIERYFVDEIVLRYGGKLVCYRDKCKNCLIGEDNQLFATKEEAEAKLEELK